MLSLHAKGLNVKILRCTQNDKARFRKKSILKNNAPRYVLLDYSLFRQNTAADDVDVDATASRILATHIKAFEELASGKMSDKQSLDLIL